MPAFGQTWERATNFRELGIKSRALRMPVLNFLSEIGGQNPKGGDTSRLRPKIIQVLKPKVITHSWEVPTYLYSDSLYVIPLFE